MKYDVIIVGGGIVGCAVARFLSQYDISVCVAEKNSDVSEGATKANSGILHAGYDCMPGSKKAKFNKEGLQMFPKLCENLQIPYKNNGSLVISVGDTKGLHVLYERGLKNGISGLEILTAEQALKLEPNLSTAVTGAMRANGAGIISPYEACIAFAENSIQNGVKFCLNTKITKIERISDGFHLSSTRGPLEAKIIINAAGVDSATVNNFLNPKQEKILPQRGEYYVLDNTVSSLVSHTIFQLPTDSGKGVLVAPTVDGNILLGPTADYVNDPYDTSTTVECLQEVLEKATITLREVPVRERIAAFAGIRAKHEGRDFILDEPLPGFINALGIDSPGLTAAPAIAREIADIALSRLEPKLKPEFTQYRKKITRIRELTPEEQNNMIQANPAYGRIVCRCEHVTEAEIIEAISRSGDTLDGIKRRTRTQMGRCQGSFCAAKIMEIASRQLSIPEVRLTKKGEGSDILAY